jgi:hypothetical protein
MALAFTLLFLTLHVKRIHAEIRRRRAETLSRQQVAR